MAALPEDLHFVIEEWSKTGSPVRVIARADNLIVARGAFDAACLDLALRRRPLEPAAGCRSPRSPAASA